MFAPGSIFTTRFSLLCLFVINHVAFSVISKLCYDATMLPCMSYSDDWWVAGVVYRIRNTDTDLVKPKNHILTWWWHYQVSLQNVFQLPKQFTTNHLCPRRFLCVYTQTWSCHTHIFTLIPPDYSQLLLLRQSMSPLYSSLPCSPVVLLLDSCKLPVVLVNLSWTQPVSCLEFLFCLDK